MIAISLQSGSNGNCIYVQAGGVRLLFDAGIAGRTARERLLSRGHHIDCADALIVSHHHSDHISSAGVFHRMFGVPIHMTHAAHAAREHQLGRVTDVRHFAPGDALDFGAVRVETVPTPHDTVDSVGFVIEAEGARLGILTDLGHVFDGLAGVVGSLDAVLLESNYDPDMLAHGPYPADLKARIRSPHGHISNAEAAALLARHADGRMRWACLAHISETNNDPRLALATHRKVLGTRLPLHVAGRYGVSEVMEL